MESRRPVRKNRSLILIKPFTTHSLSLIHSKLNTLKSKVYPCFSYLIISFYEENKIAFSQFGISRFRLRNQFRPPNLQLRISNSYRQHLLIYSIMLNKYSLVTICFFIGSIANAQHESAKTDTLSGNSSDVVVTGQFTPQQLKNSVYKVRTINQERIKLRAATDVAGLLNNELGIRFSTDYTLGESDISIMGMSGQNVKILLDGVPVVDRGSSRQSLSQIDINTIERIEMVEGPMSVVYGADALAGVINVITKKAKADKSFGVSARVQEETMGKEYAGFTGAGIHNENLAVNWGKSGWTASANITRNNAGAWKGVDTGRTNEWKPKDQWLAGGTIGYRNNKLNVWYRLNYLNETLTALGDRYYKALENKLMATDADYISTRFTHQAQADWQKNDRLSVNVSASYQDYERRTSTTDVDLNTGRHTLNITTQGGQDLATFKNAFFRTTAQYIISSKVSIQLGVEIKSDQATGQRVKADATINDYSVFVSSEIKPNTHINIRPGVRFSVNSVYDAPPVIPSLNTKFNLTKNLDFRASYARGFRAPALRELYFDFHDASHDIDGNTNLKAEYSNSFNGSFSWQAVAGKNFGFNSSVSGFYNIFKNLITTASANDPLNPNRSTYANIANYKTTGGTWENTINYKELTATLGFSYIGRYNNLSTDPSYKDENLPEFTWSPEINSNISYNIKKIGASIGFFYKFTGRTPSYRIGTSNGQTVLQLAKVSAWHWADITANKSLGKYLTLNAGAKNIFDVTRVNNTALNTGGAHSAGGGPVLKGTGRSYFIGLAFQWSKN
jgi:outer membrane receptor for ferrienterochelin and colicins